MDGSLRAAGRENHRGLPGALALNALFLCFVLVCFRVGYEGNDDPAMARLLAGAYDGVPSPYIIFINLAVSWPLARLTAVWPNLPWYALAEYAIVFAAFTAASCVLIRRDRHGGGALSLLMLCAFGFDIYTRIQFTKVAGCAVAAGALTLADALAGRRVRIPSALAGALLMALGSCYRFQMLLPVLAVMLPLALFLAVRWLRRREGRRLLRALAWVAAVLAVCAGLRVAHRAVYDRDEGWAAFMRFNPDRTKLLDLAFPDYDSNAGLYKELGLSREDISLYSGWDFADPELFNAESVHALAQARKEKKIDGAFWRAYAEKIPYGYLQYAWVPAFLITAALAAFASRRGALCTLCALIVLAGMSVLLMIYDRYLKNRVDVCLFLASTLSLAYVLLRTARRTVLPRGRTVVLCLTLAVLLFLPSWTAYGRKAQNDAEKTVGYRALGDVISADADHVYLVSPLSGNIWWDGLGIWDACPAGYTHNLCYIGGWACYSPPWNRANARNGVDNPFTFCVDNDRAYVLHNTRISAVAAYIRRHYEPDADFVLAKQISGNNFYRIVTGAPKPRIEGEIIEAPPPSFHGENISHKVEKRNLSVTGTLYLDGESSFRGEAWIELAGEDGKVLYQLLAQYENTALNAEGAPASDLHGQYSRYSAACTLPKKFKGRMSILYRCGDAWYRAYSADVAAK